MKARTILISGAGVAGPTLAYWLLEHGFEPTIVERSPEFRAGGYIIDFWGTGYTVAERMGILPQLHERGYKVEKVRLVDTNNKRIAGFAASIFSIVLSGRYTSIPRGDLAEIIYDTIKDRVETIFGDSITSLDEHEDGVHVTFEHAPARTFDLVIGADGLHSKVRELTFGPEEAFESFLGYLVAAFDAKGYPHRDESAYVSYSTPGKQAARFAMREDKSLFFFIFTNDGLDLPDPHNTAGHKKIMHQTFDEMGWECREMMEVMDTCDTVYFDRVSQIKLDSWHKGRVALLGDAAFCPSLLAGEGTSLAMGAAYVLAHMLATHEDHTAAFAAYEKTYRSLIERKQKSAAGFAESFAPRSAISLWFRNQATKLLGIPFLANLLIGGSLKDNFKLPD